MNGILFVGDGALVVPPCKIRLAGRRGCRPLHDYRPIYRINPSFIRRTYVILKLLNLKNTPKSKVKRFAKR